MNITKWIMVMAGIVALSLTSCDPASKYKTEISEIDSCLSVLDTIETRYYEIEFDSLEMMVAHIKENEALMEEHYSLDTLSLELGKNLNRSKGIRKFFGNVRGQQINFHEEIEALKTQFTNLKTDISNGTLTKEKIDQYLAKEKSDLNMLNKSFTEFYEKQIRAFEIYRYDVAQVDAFLNMIITENDTIAD